MTQIERVLKPGGYLCIIVPSGGPNYNDDLLDCCRFTRDGLKALVKYVGLNILRIGRDGRPVAKPWFDVYVFAQKPHKRISGNNKNIEGRVVDLEKKLDIIMEKIN